MLGSVMATDVKPALAQTCSRSAGDTSSRCAWHPAKFHRMVTCSGTPIFPCQPPLAVANGLQPLAVYSAITDSFTILLAESYEYNTTTRS